MRKHNAVKRISSMAFAAAMVMSVVNPATIYV